jgi:hypothetical protein
MADQHAKLDERFVCPSKKAVVCKLMGLYYGVGKGQRNRLMLEASLLLKGKGGKNVSSMSPPLC